MNQGDGNHGQYMCDEDPLNQGSGNHGELESHDSNYHDSFDGFDADMEDYVDTYGEWLGVNYGEDSDTLNVQGDIDPFKCFQTRDVGMATATFLSKHIIEQLKVDPNMPLKAIQGHLSEKFEILVSPSKATRAKQIATKKIWGDYELQYDQLRDYLGEVQRCNPDTTIKLEVETEPNPESGTRQFKRVYICLGSLKRGFKAGKRDLLGLDGTFVKGPFPGQVLTAVGIYPNHGIYPVAYAVVESESTVSWSWFLECLGDDLDLQSNSNLTFISDRQKVIIPAIQRLFPLAEHRYCLRHIHENMKLQWRGKAFKGLLWQCATAPTVPQFRTAMDHLKRFNLSCY
ncbi:hypothetical protein L6452_10805 [Arctium lappa]|uniref:Uncharacterized protein n=1 Tax=Arctium lappa TaxID=4217 RepID=A0ACB9DNF4_ARCLA|nr:hypothetical protein L6452_10805 [Arctium lappa]